MDMQIKDIMNFNRQMEQVNMIINRIKKYMTHFKDQIFKHILFKLNLPFLNRIKPHKFCKKLIG